MIRLASDFSASYTEYKKGEDFQSIEKNVKPRVLPTTKLPFRYESILDTDLCGSVQFVKSHQAVNTRCLHLSAHILHLKE